MDEGHELALEFACQFYEVSAAETLPAINVVYQALLRDARVTQQQRSNILRRRRSSLLNPRSHRTNVAVAFLVR